MTSIVMFLFYLTMKFISFVEYLFMGYIILGWFVFFGAVKNKDSIFFKIYIFLMDKIEPILGFFRRFLPNLGGFDLSAIVFFVVLHLLRNIVAKIFMFLF